MSIKKSIGLLIGGTALAQIFTFAISPILTRLYNPETFGLLGTVLAASSIIAAFSHLRLNLAIAQAKTLKEAVLILKTAVIFSITICFISAFFIYSSSFLFDSAYTLTIALIIFILSLSNSLIDIFNFWQSYRGQHALSARNTVIRSFATGVPQIALGFFHHFGLIFGVIFGSIVGCVLFLREFIQSKNNVSTKINQRNFFFVLNKYKDFPLYSMPQGLIASLSLNAVPIIIGAKFGVAIAGQYWLAYRVLIAPISVIGTSYRQVLLPIFSKNNIEHNRKIVFKHTFFLSLIILPIIFILFYIFPILFKFIFGDSWIIAGELAGWLVLGFGADIIKVPVFSFLQSYGKHKFLLIYEMVLGLSRLIILFLGAVLYSYLKVIACFAMVGMFFSYFLIFFILFNKKLVAK